MTEWMRYRNICFQCDDDDDDDDDDIDDEADIPAVFDDDIVIINQNIILSDNFDKSVVTYCFFFWLYILNVDLWIPLYKVDDHGMSSWFN